MDGRRSWRYASEKSRKRLCEADVGRIIAADMKMCGLCAWNHRPRLCLALCCNLKRPDSGIVQRMATWYTTYLFTKWPRLLWCPIRNGFVSPRHRYASKDVTYSESFQILKPSFGTSTRALASDPTSLVDVNLRYHQSFLS